MQAFEFKTKIMNGIIKIPEVHRRVLAFYFGLVKLSGSALVLIQPWEGLCKYHLSICPVLLPKSKPTS